MKLFEEHFYYCRKKKFHLIISLMVFQLLLKLDFLKFYFSILKYIKYEKTNLILHKCNEEYKFKVFF